MRFGEKLQRLRKEKNLSQEELASKLEVSRQAVSKWESNSSYPDMDKIIQICNVLDCNLADIMDDGVIEKNDSKNNTNNISDKLHGYFNDFLNMITQIYNMFFGMSSKARIICIIEMSVLFILLIVGFDISISIINYFLREILSIFPYFITNILLSLFISISIIILGLICVIIFIHIFKIRYLDYYVTVSDKNVEEKIIEKPVESKEDKNYVEKPKEKMIIRDTKHSNYGFFKLISDIIIFFIKIMIAPFVLMFAFMYLLLFFILIFSILNVINHIIFIALSFLLLGSLIICYYILKSIFYFIFNCTIDFKVIFSKLIAGTVLIALSSAGLIIILFNFEITDKELEKELFKTINVDITDNMDFVLNNTNVTYIEDNLLSEVKIDIYTTKYVSSVEFEKKNYDNYNTNDDHITYYMDTDYISVKNIYNDIVKDLKDNKVKVNYVENDFQIELKIYCSKEDCEYIRNNSY